MFGSYLLCFFFKIEPYFTSQELLNNVCSIRTENERHCRRRFEGIYLKLFIPPRQFHTRFKSCEPYPLRRNLKVFFISITRAKDIQKIFNYIKSQADVAELFRLENLKCPYKL